MDARNAVAALAALAQESRLGIYRLLVEAGPTGLAVGEIGASLHVAPATLSFHLKELVHAGLIAPRQVGRFIYYSPSFEKMESLLGYLTENCCARDGLSCGPGCGPAAPAKNTASPKPRAVRRARRESPKS